MMEFISTHSTILSVLAGFLVSLPLMRSKSAGTGTDSFSKLACYCLLYSAVSVAAVVIFAAFESLIGGNGITFGAVSTYGVYFISPLILLLLFGRNGRKRAFFDMYAFYVIPSMIIQRIRCMIKGCCYGIFIMNTQYRYPVRIAEMAFYLIMWFVLERKSRTNGTGSLFPLLMISYGAFRFINEFFRYSPSGSLFHLAHIWSAICLIIGLSLYPEFRNKQ